MSSTLNRRITALEGKLPHASMAAGLDGVELQPRITWPALLARVAVHGTRLVQGG
jgi:hypothetical protein